MDACWVDNDFLDILLSVAYGQIIRSPIGFLAECRIWAEMILVTKWFGSFICDDGKVRKVALFPKDAAAIASRLGRIMKGDLLDEEIGIASSAKQVADRRLSDFGKVVKLDSSFIKPESYGFTIDIYREATIILAKDSVRSSIGPDVHLGQAVRAYDDLVFTTNILSERLREWYGLHFPELEVVMGGDAYPKAIAEHGSRHDIMSELKLGMDSIGSEIAPQDLESLKVLANALVESYSARAKIERYVEARMQEVAPNVSALVGPVIGARLIMLSGNLMRLASFPSSTVQLLGAEKAMFRHLKKGSPPPKHGVLFQHPLVHNAPLWQRGAIARAIAAKTCLAARADAYSKSDISPILKEQLDKRIAEIRKQHAAPPKKKPAKTRRGRR